MKERAQKAIRTAIRVALILTFVDLSVGKGFSLSKTGLYLLAAFIVDLILASFLGRKKNGPANS